MKKRILVTAFAAVAATVFPASPSQAQTVLTVDDNGVQCPNATFTSIQDAVDAAAAGDEIRVCPGQYNESVDVPASKPNLRLVGPAVAPSSTACYSAGTPNPSTQAIIQDINAVAIVQLNADGVRFSRFTVRGNTSSAGILTDAAHSGYQVRQNRVENNVFGIHFLSSGTTLSDAEQNCVRLNNAAGAGTGNGIFAELGLENAEIEGNSFFNQDTSAITLEGAAVDVDDVTVRGNNSREDDSIVALFNTSDVDVISNSSRRNTGSAIFLGPDNTGAGITNNSVDRAARGVRADASSFAGPPSTDVTIFNNIIQNSTGTHGISAATDSLTDSLISTNVTLFNEVDGISLATGNGHNDIRNNVAVGNGTLDCNDDTTGAGTAGTDNIWTNDVGAKSDPPAICI
jgi:hypothetical protein